jgi:predicted transposase YdaD
LLELPQQPLTDFIREKIIKLRIMLKSQPHLTTNDQETLLNIDALYEDWRNQTIQEGMAVGWQEGRQEGDRTTLESMLVVKFGKIDRKLAPVIPASLALSPIDRVRAVMQLSQEEIIRDFGQ